FYRCDPMIPGFSVVEKPNGTNGFFRFGSSVCYGHPQPLRHAVWRVGIPLIGSVSEHRLVPGSKFFLRPVRAKRRTARSATWRMLTVMPYFLPGGMSELPLTAAEDLNGHRTSIESCSRKSTVSDPMAEFG